MPLKPLCNFHNQSVSFAMTSLECRPSRIKLLRLLCLTCVMVAVCWFCTTLDEIVPVVVGWIGMIFFGYGFIVFPRAWMNAGTPSIVVGPDGIDDRQSHYGFIPWQDITCLTVHSVKGTRMLSVHVADTDAYLSRLPGARRIGAAANQSLGFAPITLGFSSLTPGIDEVLHYIQTLGYNIADPENAA